MGDVRLTLRWVVGGLRVSRLGSLSSQLSQGGIVNVVILHMCGLHLVNWQDGQGMLQPAVWDTAVQERLDHGGTGNESQVGWHPRLHRSGEERLLLRVLKEKGREGRPNKRDISQLVSQFLQSFIAFLVAWPGMVMEPVSA